MHAGKMIRWTAVLAVMLVLPLFLVSARAGTAEYRVFDARVIHVSDGDTVTVLDGREQVRIRIAGIDAPEKRQAFGRRSELAMEGLVLGKTARITARKKDRYGRLVASIAVNGRDAGLELVTLGLAWVYRQYDRELSESLRLAYYQAEKEARRRRAGLWSDSSPVAPWDYRKAEREARQAKAARR